MKNPTILTKHKNSLLSIIQESGLDPNIFTAKDTTIDEDDYFVIRLANSQILFGARPWEASFTSFNYRHSLFRLGFQINAPRYAENFVFLASRFKEWLESIVKPYLDDVATPDLWRILEETRTHTRDKSVTPEDFESFSEDEKLGIRLSLKDFRLLIVKNFKLNREELQVIDARLKYLSDAVEKHNKFDWKGIAINTVIAIIIALSLDPEQGNKLFQLFKQVFSHIIYLLPSA
jgi:hypothetical protein